MMRELVIKPERQRDVQQSADLTASLRAVEESAETLDKLLREAKSKFKRVPPQARSQTAIRRLIDPIGDVVRKLGQMVGVGGRVVANEDARKLIDLFIMHSRRLVAAIRSCKVPAELVDPTKTGELDIIKAADLLAKSDENAGWFDLPVNELDLYRQLGGFSDEEYEHLVKLRKSLRGTNFDLDRAFDAFANDVLTDLEKKKYQVKLEDFQKGLAGLVGIATDFGTALRPVAPMIAAAAGHPAALAAALATAKPAMVSALPSVFMGIVGIGQTFWLVGKKLLGSPMR
jgi:hypothetical protein